MSTLQYFLNNHRSISHCTHTSTNPRGKFSIPEEKLEEFLSLYTNALDNGKTLSITEFSPNSYIPVLVDVDLKKIVESDEITMLYDSVNVCDIVYCFIDVFKEILMNVSEEDLCCFVMERPGYFIYNDNQKFYKNGFHLHFPKIFLTRIQQEYIVIPIVKQRMKSKHVSLPKGMTYDTIFDESIYKGKGKPWYMYGSTKKEALQPYLCKYMFHGSKKKDFNWESYLLQNEFKNDDYDKLKNNCVRFFSLLGSDKESHYRQIDPNVELLDKEINQMNSSKSSSSHFDFDSINKQIRIYESDSHVDEIVDSMLSLLPEKYYEEYDLWIRVGWILHNQYLGTYDGFYRWDDFSKQSFDKYDSERIVKEWSKMRLENYTYATLIHFVKKDNPEGFRSFFHQRSENYFLSALSQDSITHNDIANILYSKFSDNYKCASIKPNIWYVFSEHIWKLSDDGVELRNHISTTVAQRFLSMKKDLQQSEKRILETKKQKAQRDLKHLVRQSETIKEYMDELDQNESEDRIERIQRKSEYDKLLENIESQHETINKLQNEIDTKSKPNASVGATFDKQQKPNSQQKRITNIVNNLKTVPFKKNVMLEASDLFRDQFFLERLNKNKWLICFNNGVYDLQQNKFRDGEPNDYISVKMNVNYREDFTLDSPAVQMAERFFVQIFPDESLRRYFLAIQSEIFVGSNTNKIFMIWTGEGDNGKSVTTDIFEKMLGPYSVKLPTSLIIGKRTQSSSASPELERLGNGVRFATVQEPNSSDQINTGIMKELSGNDKFYARGLHKNPIEVHPMFTPVMICNKPPNISNSQYDEAVWNRVRTIPFESTFPRDSSIVPHTEEEQIKKKIFPRDPNFADKIPDMLEGVAYYLLHIYRTKSKEDMREPDKVMQATNNYRKANDVFRAFLDEKIQYSEGAKIYLSNIYNIFKEWYRNSIPNGLVPKKDDMKEYLIRYWGEPEGRQHSWLNFSVIYEDMVEEENVQE
jgi:P4 family phage/plasmid primase-like protien